MSMDLEEQYDKIYRYCYGKLHDRALAEDVTQETFLRYFAAGSYREQGKALRYLYVTARNLCTDEYRRTKPEALQEETAPPVPDGMDQRLETMALAAAVEALDDEERELVLLRYVNDVPVGVIAGLLGISRFAVYRRTAAILEKLRRRLEGEP